MSTLDFETIENQVRHNPALEDKKDSRDIPVAAAITASVDVPETFSLRDSMTPVKNQGSRGTCTAFAAAAIAEYLNGTEWDNMNIDLSEEFQFYNTKQYDIRDYGYDGYGAYLRSACKAYQKEGICTEDLAPYRFNEPEGYWQEFTPTDEQEQEAKVYRSRSYLRVDANEDAIKRAIISTEAPVLCGFHLYRGYREARDNGGYIPHPDVNNDERIGGHAMAIVGWTKDHWVIKNSWGDGWGDGGYVYWPISATQDTMFSAWSFTDLITNPRASMEEQIKENYRNTPEWAKHAYEKALQKGVANQDTDPLDALDKAELMVFLDRAGVLDGLPDETDTSFLK